MSQSATFSTLFQRLRLLLSSQGVGQEVKACLALATPLSIAQLIEVSMITVDTLTMGALGGQALAGGALGYTTFRFLTAIGFRTISAVNTIAAIAFGAKQNDRLGTIVTQGFYLALFLALPVMLILGTSSLWMGILGQEIANVQLSRAYLGGILWGIPALFLYDVLRNVVTAVNRPGVVTAIAGGSIFLNAGANYVLAFGKFGFPALGLAGIGYATTFVVWIQLLAALLYIGFSEVFREFNILQASAKFDRPTFAEIFDIGWTNGIYCISGAGYQVVLVYLFGFFGSVPLAAFQIANQVCLLIRDMVWGLAQAIIARVGQMYGQQSKSGARRAGFVGIFLGILTAIIYLSIVAVGREQVVSLFIRPETEMDFAIFKLAVTFLLVVVFLQVFNEIETTALAALRGIKDTRVPLFVGIFNYWVVGVGSACLLAFHFELQGIGLLIGYYLSLIMSSIFMPIRFYIQSGKLDFPSDTSAVKSIAAVVDVAAEDCNAE